MPNAKGFSQLIILILIAGAIFLIAKATFLKNRATPTENEVMTEEVREDSLNPDNQDFACRKTAEQVAPGTSLVYENFFAAGDFDSRSEVALLGSGSDNSAAFITCDVAKKEPLSVFAIVDEPALMKALLNNPMLTEIFALDPERKKDVETVTTLRDFNSWAVKHSILYEYGNKDNPAQKQHSQKDLEIAPQNFVINRVDAQAKTMEIFFGLQGIKGSLPYLKLTLPVGGVYGAQLVQAAANAKVSQPGSQYAEISKLLLADDVY